MSYQSALWSLFLFSLFLFDWQVKCAAIEENTCKLRKHLHQFDNTYVLIKMLK